MSENVAKNEREWWAKKRIEELQDFAIWMLDANVTFDNTNISVTTR